MREPAIIIVIAANRTGKTTYVKQLLKISPRERKLIVTDSYNPDWRGARLLNSETFLTNPNFKGVKRVEFMENEKDTFLHVHNVRNALVIFDDAKEYIPTSLEQAKDFKKILSGFTHTMRSDIIFVFHAPDQVTKRIYDHASYLIIGKCTSIADHRMRLDKIGEIIAAQHRVNAAYDKAQAENRNFYGIFEVIKLR